MAQSLISITTLTLLTTLLLSLSPTHSSPLLSFIYGGCSQIKYNPNDVVYTTNLNSLITSLVNSATYSSYNHFTVVGTTSHEAVHGLYQCRGDLPMPDCATCVAHSVGQLSGFCPGSCGAAIQLQGCYVKYDNDTFVGHEDKTVVFKKCGTPVGNEDDHGGRIAARDAVLDGLVNGPGLYRVGGSKDVQGMAQCVGDLSGAQCQDCVGEAVKQVKMVCGSGSYGDLYLGKCYLRYTVGGSDGGRGYFNSNNGSGSSSDKNRGVKTFALVIGLLAAIAILIIFCTFICRAFGRSSGK